MKWNLKWNFFLLNDRRCLIKIEIGFGCCGWIEWVGGVPDFVCFAQHDTLIGSSTQEVLLRKTQNRL